MAKAMHDWTLVSILMDWQSARVTINLQDHASTKTVVAEGVQDLRVPHECGWGPSVSVNEAYPIESLSTGLKRLRIEMQSGDVIEIVADEFDIPRN